MTVGIGNSCIFTYDDKINNKISHQFIMNSVKTYHNTPTPQWFSNEVELNVDDVY
jgi:hypothetical protein